MKQKREIHEELLFRLNFHDQKLVELFIELREFILSIYPESNELIYDTHALTTVFSPTLKLGDAFCHIPIYTKHFNLGFNKGTLLKDPDRLLKGTGKLIRHIPITQPSDFSGKGVTELLVKAIDFSKENMDPDNFETGISISKIKK